MRVLISLLDGRLEFGLGFWALPFGLEFWTLAFGLGRGPGRGRGRGLGWDEGLLAEQTATSKRTRATTKTFLYQVRKDLIIFL